MATNKPGNLNPDASAKGSISFGGSNTRANVTALRASGVGAKARALSLTHPRIPYTPNSRGVAKLTVPPKSSVGPAPVFSSNPVKVKSPFKGTAISDYWSALKKKAF